jgi:hypothetical protein
MNPNYQLGLLCLSHLLICADGVVDVQEAAALELIRKREKISEKIYQEFQRVIAEKKERDLYQHGINLINLCSDDEKLRAFVMLYKLSEVDGRVHIKEIRLLLYSIKLANVAFNDVVEEATSSPPLL